MPLPGPAGMGLVSDKPQGGVRGKKQRLKREDHTYVKHDKSFCDWKVLVGPTDWKEHAAGKIPDRFRVNNLPSYYDGAGIYELGVTPPAWLPPQKNSDTVFLKPQDVVVVYLGCAEHVYHHLQRYGQTGAHLEGVRSTRLFTAKNESSGATPSTANLDKSRSFPSTQSQTTSVDKAPGAGDGGYMSTRSSNASALDVMDEKVSSSDLTRSRSLRGPRLFSEAFALGCSVAFRWAVTESKPAAEKAASELIDIFDYAWKRGGNFRQRSPDILAKIVQAGTLNSSDASTCFGNYALFKKTPPGITIAARRPPDDPITRTRTTTTTRSNLKLKPYPKSSEFTKLDIPLERCGVLLEGGRPCSALPVKGGKRCLLHKKSTQKRPARVANMSPSHEVTVDEPSASSCFPYLQSPSPTKTVAVKAKSPDPPKRHGSLSFTSWLRTSELRLARSREWADQTTNSLEKSEKPDKRSVLTTCEESLVSPTCRSPTSRREICGLRLDDGTVCPEPPRPERKRCVAHKGLRNMSPRRSGVPVRAF